MSDTTSLSQALNAVVNNQKRPLASLSVATFAHGKVAYQEAFGFARIEPTGPVLATPDTLYRVASISKLVVAMAVMKLVESGTLDLDRDLSDYFGWSFRNPNQPEAVITARHLLSHTSSIRDGGESYSAPIGFSIRDFLGVSGRLFSNGVHWAGSSKQAGAHFDYANLNYGVLGTLVELISAERFDVHMQRVLFEPANIHASYGPYGLAPEAISTLATLYRKRNSAGIWNSNGEWYPQVDDFSGVRPARFAQVENPDVGDQLRAYTDGNFDDYSKGENATLFSPQGGLRISVPDLAKLGMMLIDCEEMGLFSAETQAKMFAPAWTLNQDGTNGNSYGGLMRQWGLGIHRVTDASAPGNGDRLAQDGSADFIGHSGEAYGLLSGLWFHPKRQVGFAYAIGGTGADLEKQIGAYSSFTSWEEEIMTALMNSLAQSDW